MRAFHGTAAARGDEKAGPEAVGEQELALRVLRRLEEVTRDERVMQQLQTIRTMKEGKVMQWQFLVGTMQTTLDACLGEVYEAAGLPLPDNFTELLYRACKEQGGQEVRSLHSKCWQSFVDTAFGEELTGDEGQKVSFTLKEARRYVSLLVEIFTSSEVLDGMQQAMLRPDWSDRQLRMHAVHEVLLPPHLKLLKKFGFEGERGYVLAQRSLLVDHMPDRSILDSASALSHIVVNYVQQEPAADPPQDPK